MIFFLMSIEKSLLNKTNSKFYDNFMFYMKKKYLKNVIYFTLSKTKNK